MRTTLVIDDDLYRQIKAKAAWEGRTVTDLVEQGMRMVLGTKTSTRAGGRRVPLPLVPARPGAEVLFGGMTVDEIHERLSVLQLDAERESVESPP